MPNDAIFGGNFRRLIGANLGLTVGSGRRSNKGEWT